MGCASATGLRSSQRRMEPGRTGQTHQRAGVVGGHESTAGMAYGLNRQVCADSLRQFNSSGIPQQTGRNKIPVPVSVGHRSLGICADVCHRPTGPSYPGETECPSRRTVKAANLRHRMDPGTSSVSVAIDEIPPHDVRSLRHTTQQSAAEIHLTVSRPDGTSSRCPISCMGGQRCLRVSSDATDPQSPEQTGEFCRRDDSHSPPGSTQGVVLHAIGQDDTDSPEDTCLTGLTQTTPLGSAERKPRISASACLQIVRRALKAKGFSSPAVVRIVGSRRKSTLTVYDKKWSRLAGWCAENNLHPLRLSSPQLANFFIELFEKDNLQPITIKGYRAAISRVYKLTGATWNPGTDMFLSELLKNFSLERPTTNRLLPKWSLEVVLEYLNSDEFEPLTSAELKKIAQKAAFLLTLATAARVSEIHALSAARIFSHLIRTAQ